MLTFHLTLSSAKHPDKPSWAHLFQEVLHRAEALPGVQSAGLVLLRPLSGPIGWDYDFTIDGQTAEAQRTNPTSNHERVSPGYFRTLGIPLLAGRDFTATDTMDTQRVVIVNKSTADRFWPGQDPLGKRLRFGTANQPSDQWLTVVGVVGDVRYREIQAVRPDLYIPHYLQSPHWAMDLVVRTSSDPMLARPLAEVVRSLDPDLPVANPDHHWMQAIAGSIARPRLRTLILDTLRRSRADSRRGRYLRHHRLLGGTAPPGDRHPHGNWAAYGDAAAPCSASSCCKDSVSPPPASPPGCSAALLLILTERSSGWLGGLLYGVAPTDLATFATVPLLLPGGRRPRQPPPRPPRHPCGSAGRR